MDSLTPNQELYCQARARGLSQRAAYREAYPRSREWRDESADVAASRLEANAKVSPRLEALMEEAAKRAVITRAQVLDGMAQTFRAATRSVGEEGLGPVAATAVSSIGGKLLEALPDAGPAEERPFERDFALLLAPPFLAVHRDLARDEGGEYWEYGGRCSAKSSSISLELVGGLMRHPERSAIVFLKVGAFIRTGPYEQVLWALDELGVSGEWECTVQPLQCRRVATGQVIAFRGLDDAGKTKSIKAPAGTYWAYQWYEEADQFRGMAEVRKAQQSVTRGPHGAPFFRFFSFNPPRSRMSWANRAVQERIDAGLPVYRSSYLDLPPEWVPDQVRDDAEELRRTDEPAYLHEWMGEPTGTGTEVFDRVVFREVTDAEIAAFDNPRVGQDFGWYPDPWAVTMSEWQPGRLALVTYAERVANKLKPDEQAARIAEMLTWSDDPRDREPSYHHVPVRSDDAEPATIAQQRDAGVNARAAGKGSMRDASYRFLQAVTWVIDPRRCPNLAREVRGKEYEVNRDGEVTNDIPDGDDHCIDATRYAVMAEARSRYAYRGGGDT